MHFTWFTKQNKRSEVCLIKVLTILICKWTDKHIQIVVCICCLLYFCSNLALYGDDLMVLLLEKCCLFMCLYFKRINIVQLYSPSP